ncbi:hypothetical protein DSY4337 [Desulfitobacterium hafniense Y51]|uniref:Uncharacterized protein n=1 Tax=Desulfitobacterium hafniense (strain Y51) TaxID=138119 RepID=Q24PB6_DESHY|nr:hypothetical protein DSY4337 [Desulfitobacterium hafniense Y51]
MESIHHMRPDISSYQDNHDIITQLKLTFIKPNPDMENPVHLISFRNYFINLCRIISEFHAFYHGPVINSLAHFCLRRLTHNAIMNQKHSLLYCRRISFCLFEPLINRWRRFFHFSINHKSKHSFIDI